MDVCERQVATGVAGGVGFWACGAAVQLALAADTAAIAGAFTAATALAAAAPSGVAVYSVGCVWVDQWRRGRQ